MEKSLSLRTEGLIKIVSGSMTVIDPCYLTNFDFKKFLLYERTHELTATSLATNVNILRLKLEFEKDKDKKAQLKKRLEEMQAQVREYKSTPSLSPPYICQLKKGVVVRNGIGDGDYPITESGGFHRIVFNFPINQRGDLDKTRLKGNLVGFSDVEGGTQYITDSHNVKVGPDVRKELYCSFSVPKGNYSCRFAANKDSLLIRKIT